MRVWIDLAAPPQVLFFRPVIQALQREAHELLVTVRDFDAAPAIATQLGIKHRVVGLHGGRGSMAKGTAIVRRVAQLVSVARPFRPHVAVSHNSYAQALAAAFLRVPLVTAMDFEHQPANHVSFRIADRILVPEAFPAAALRRFGADPKRVVRYPGVKEELYLADFEPDPSFPAVLDLPADRVIVTMRPPARSALYHRFDNPLFDAAFAHVRSDPHTVVLLVERLSLQPPVDGPNLVYWSDLVIGAGGTMTREAAILGTPAYTVYGGRPIAVDNYLIEQGRLERLESTADLARIKLEKKRAARSMARPAALQQVVATIRAVGDPSG